MADITFNCPHCENHIVVDERGAGMELPCPHCAQPLVIPRPNGQAASGASPVLNNHTLTEEQREQIYSETYMTQSEKHLLLAANAEDMRRPPSNPIEAMKESLAHWAAEAEVAIMARITAKYQITDAQYLIIKQEGTKKNWRLGPSANASASSTARDPFPAPKQPRKGSIKEVAVFITHSFPQGSVASILFGTGKEWSSSLLRTPPKELFAQADSALSLNGALVSYVKDKGGVLNYEDAPKMSDSEWADFLDRRFSGPGQQWHRWVGETPVSIWSVVVVKNN